MLHDCVAQRNDPRGAAARRRPACLLCSRRLQHPCASTEPAHGLGRGRSAENGSVDRRPAALRGAVPRRRTGLGRAAPEAGEGWPRSAAEMRRTLSWRLQRIPSGWYTPDGAE